MAIFSRSDPKTKRMPDDPKPGKPKGQLTLFQGSRPFGKKKLSKESNRASNAIDDIISITSDEDEPSIYDPEEPTPQEPVLKRQRLLSESNLSDIGSDENRPSSSVLHKPWSKKQRIQSESTSTLEVANPSTESDTDDDDATSISSNEDDYAPQSAQVVQSAVPLRPVAPAPATRIPAQNARYSLEGSIVTIKPYRMKIPVDISLFLGPDVVGSASTTSPEKADGGRIDPGTARTRIDALLFQNDFLPNWLVGKATRHSILADWSIGIVWQDVILPTYQSKYAQRHAAQMITACAHFSRNLDVGSSKWNLFYDDPRLFGDQCTSDRLASQMVTSMGLRLCDVGVVPARRGEFQGPPGFWFTETRPDGTLVEVREDHNLVSIVVGTVGVLC
ncbi:hypothetical protein FRC07_012244 [Ceratobasidium sp. 392]|nr:hypothetical protein FRC07_012244 [Ceratobasidium sp. 392]